MATTTPVQNYANHVHRPVLFGIAFLATVVAFAFFVAEMIRFRGPLMYGVLSLSVAVLCLTLVSRVYIVRLQDRIIRLEMQVRMARLGLEPVASRLTVKQLVALRFASDAELPALAQRAAAESLSPADIKKAVTNWQADWLRT